MALLIALALGAWFLFGVACQPAAAPPPAAPPVGAPPAVPAAAATAAPTPVALRLGLNTPSAEVTPAWVAKDAGIFARYGLEVELVTMPADLLVAALMSGELPVSQLSSSAVVSSVIGGSDLVFIGSYQSRLRFLLYAQPDITTVADLRGKQVAITSRGGIIRRATVLVLERNGLDPDRDVTMVATGNVNNSLAALRSGAVAAGMISAAARYEAEEGGLRLLVDTAEYNYPAIIQGIAVSRRWLSANADVARRVLQAHAEGVAFARRDKERTKEIIARYAQLSDPVALERAYEAYAPGWEFDLRAPAEGVRGDLEALAQENPAAREFRPEQFVDNTLVEALEREGFFQRVFQP